MAILVVPSLKCIRLCKQQLPQHIANHGQPIGGDVAIFRFFPNRPMATDRHLGFVEHVLRPPTRNTW